METTEKDPKKVIIWATVETLKEVPELELRHGEIGLERDERTFGPVTSVIELKRKGENVRMMLSFEKQCIIALVERMIGEKCEDINFTVKEAVEDLISVIAETAAKQLEKTGQLYTIAQPMTVFGQGVQRHKIAEASVLHVPFFTRDGSFVLEVVVTN